MTIIEVLVSLFIIGGLIVLYAASFNMIALTKTLKNENLAYHIASKKIEDLRNTTYASLPPSGTFTETDLNQLPSSSANFTISNYSTYNGMKEIVVNVNWNDGKARSVTVRTVVGTGGINP